MNNCTKCAAGTVPAAPEYNRASNCNQPACSLHTVVIPKAKGGSSAGQPFAPILGGYQNAIVVYEADGAVYLYDENGIFTSLTGISILPVIEALKAEVEASTAQVNQLNSALTKEVTNRQSADVDMQALITTLQSQLNAETTARESADTTLTNNYNALKAQVNGMAGDTSAEATAREAGDTELQTQITANQTAIATETANRLGADATFTNSIENLQASVEQLSTKVDNAVGKTTNLPDNMLQQLTVNSNPTGNNVTLQTTNMDLTTGDTNSQVDTISFKTVGGQSILGEGDIPASGGGGLDPADKAKLDSLADITSAKIAGVASSTAVDISTIEVRRFPLNVNEGNGKYRQAYSFEFLKTYTAPPTIFCEFFDSALPDIPTIGSLPSYAIREVTTTGAKIFYGQADGQAATTATLQVLIIGS